MQSAVFASISMPGKETPSRYSASPKDPLLDRPSASENDDEDRSGDENWGDDEDEMEETAGGGGGGGQAAGSDVIDQATGEDRVADTEQLSIASNELVAYSYRILDQCMTLCDAVEEVQAVSIIIITVVSVCDDAFWRLLSS